MNTLIINKWDGLGLTLWKMWGDSKEPSYLSFLNGLEYVTCVSYRYNTCSHQGEQVLTFETEQDKMFFLLKYT